MKSSRVLGFLFFFITLSFAAQLFAEAAPPALKMKHSIDLKQFEGKTFLEAMTEKNDGIKANLDEDFEDDYKVADWKMVSKALDGFDDKVVGKLLRSFSDGKKGLRELTESLEGKDFKPSNMVAKVRPELGKEGDVYALAQFLAMASGAGTLVNIDEQNYYYNYGYKSGENDDDVKSGRSFGASPGHKANDASDVFYLTELGQYLDETSNPKSFYTTLLEVLTQCKTSGFAGRKLSGLGKAVATDFVAIYTAESDRHIMVDLDPKNHPWKMIAEVTFLAAYGTEAGKVMRNAKLEDGEPKAYWAKSKVSNRSGIVLTVVVPGVSVVAGKHGSCPGHSGSNRQCRKQRRSICWLFRMNLLTSAVGHHCQCSGQAQDCPKPDSKSPPRPAPRAHPPVGCW